MFDCRPLILATALVAWVGVAYSQTKPQPNNEHGALSAQQGSAQPTPSPNSLSQRQITKAISDGINAAAKEYEAHHPPPPPDNSGWFFNLFVVLFTGGLVVVGAGQCYLTFRTLQVTQTTAEAASRAATAAVRAQLPFLTLHQFDLFRRLEPGETGNMMNIAKQLPRKMLVAVTFTNFGSTPAEITSGCLEWLIAKRAAELPLPPPYRNIIPYVPGANVTTGNRIALDVPRDINLTESQQASLNADKPEESLFIFGFIAFKDFLGEPHEVRVCGKWARAAHDRPPSAIVWDTETPAEYTKRT